MKKHAKYVLFLILILSWVHFGMAQIVYFPYFGKNKVLYTKFDWNHYETDHFDIYFYTEDLDILKDVATLAESAYKRISNDIKHELSAPVPLLYYMSTTEMAQSNLNLPEGVLGAAEPVLYRIIVRGDMPLDELQDLIEHELTHIFEYDLLWGSPGGALYAVSRPPGWIFEGFAEYNTQKWSSWSSLIVRDAVLNDRIPDLSETGQLYSQHFYPRPPDYDFGHAIFDYIEETYGKNGIRDFWHSMKNSSFVRRSNPIKKAFNVTPKEFNHEFKKFIRAKHRPFLLRENPEDYSFPLGPEFPMNPYYFSFSHALSPSGDIIAALLMNFKAYDYDIVLFSADDGRIIKNITKGYTLKYENIKFEIDPSRGKDITWSPDGDQIAFFGRADEKYSLIVINALTGKTLKNIKIQEDQPAAPSFFPGGEELIYTAFKDGRPDLFKIHLSTGNVLNLTEDEFFEKAPTVSPDGKQIAYTVRIDSFDKIFISPINNLKKKTQLTFGRGDTITPEFSADSQKIYFSGDMREAFNIYSLDLKTGELVRYTDVRTGNFFPIPVSSESNKIIFSAFNKGAFQVFKSEFEGEVEKTVTFKEVEPEEEFRRFEPILTFEIDKNKVKAHKGMGKLYLDARPPVGAIVSTDGSIYGGSAISFSDIMGDYNFYIMAYQVQSFRSYYFSYTNLKKRLHYMVSAYDYTLFYYSYYSSFATPDPLYYDRYTYRDAIATRKISGIDLSFYYPFNRYYRTQASLGYSHYEEEYFDPSLAGASVANYFWNGSRVSATFSLTGETTRFKNYGPATGNTFQLVLIQALPVSKSFIQNTTVQLDFRHYLYLGSDFLFAFRFKGFASRGRDPYLFYYGGNNEVRSAYYYSIVGTEGWYANLEFRVPLVSAANTILGQLGPIRGTIFLDVTRAKLGDSPAQFYRFENGRFVFFDAMGSFGYGIEFFLFGLPFHIEFAKTLEFPDFSKPFKYDTFGKFQTKFWIGFDF